MEKKDRSKKVVVEDKYDSRVTIFETVEEAAEEAKRQAAGTSMMPTAIMISARDGYATGDGMIHRHVVDGASVAAETPVVAPKAVEDVPEVDASEDADIAVTDKSEAKAETAKPDTGKASVKKD